MPSFLSNRNLFLFALAMGLVSVAIGVLRVVEARRASDEAVTVPSQIPSYSFPIERIPDGAQRDLHEIVQNEPLTLVAVVRIGCEACEQFLKKEYSTLLEMEDSGVRSVILVDNYSPERMPELSRKVALDYDYYSTPLSLATTLGFRVSPSCYLISSDGLVLNGHQVQYPLGWNEILKEARSWDSR